MKKVENIIREISRNWSDLTKVEMDPKVWAAEQNEEGYQTPSLEEVFGDDSNDIREAYDEFTQMLIDRDECCIDAARIAVANDPESMKLYGTFITCCGSEDIGKEVNGVLYMFGANFGH